MEDTGKRTTFPLHPFLKKCLCAFQLWETKLWVYRCFLAPWVPVSSFIHATLLIPVSSFPPVPTFVWEEITPKHGLIPFSGKIINSLPVSLFHVFPLTCSLPFPYVIVVYWFFLILLNGDRIACVNWMQSRLPPRLADFFSSKKSWLRRPGGKPKRRLGCCTARMKCQGWLRLSFASRWPYSRSRWVRQLGLRGERQFQLAYTFARSGFLQFWDEGLRLVVNGFGPLASNITELLHFPQILLI